MEAARDLWNRLTWWLRRRPVPATWRVRVPPLLDIHYNEVLEDDQAIELAIARLVWSHPTPSKTWDFFKAAHFLTYRFPRRDARVLDVGCVGSPILEWLYGRGFRHLAGVDLAENPLPVVPGLVFHRASLTRTPFPDRSFDAITCISVLEHGVDQEAFLKEADRLLTPDGVVLISTDFHEPAIATADVSRADTFGLPWTVFDRHGIETLIERARGHGLVPYQPMRWCRHGAPVIWNGKCYTFVFLALVRP